MMEYKYILEPYSGIKARFTCPSCNKKLVYSRYISTSQKEYLPFEFGRCNREIKCGYHKFPLSENSKQFKFKDEKPFNFLKTNAASTRKNVNPSYHPFELVRESQKQFDQNAFVRFLISRFGTYIASRAISEYHLGTSKKYRKSNNGGVIFWNIDINGNVRNGKIMGYDSVNCKRIKTPYPLQNWVHSVLGLKDFNLSHCFYGEHLLRKYPRSKIAIVESEKTAIISSIFLPQYIWLATGNLNGLTLEKAKVLMGREVLLFPDLSEASKVFEKWSNQASQIKRFTKSIQVVDVLERLAPEEDKFNGYDLGDYFLGISLDDWQKIISKQTLFIDHKSRIIINKEGNPASVDYKNDNKKIIRTKLELFTSKNEHLIELIKKFGLIER